MTKDPSDNDDLRFDCGCHISSVDETFVVRPCSDTCDVFALAVEEIRKKQLPVATIDMRRAGKLPYRPTCPFCGELLNGFTSNDTLASPAAGNFAVCVYCSKVGVFTGNGIRKPTADEQIEIDNDKETSLLRDSVRAIRRHQ